jgi:hypothetical protein
MDLRLIIGVSRIFIGSAVMGAPPLGTMFLVTGGSMLWQRLIGT